MARDRKKGAQRGAIAGAGFGAVRTIPAAIAMHADSRESEKVTRMKVPHMGKSVISGVVLGSAATAGIGTGIGAAIGAKKRRSSHKGIKKKK